MHINIPEHAFNYLQMSQGTCQAIDLMTNKEQTVAWQADQPFVTQVMGYGGKIYEIKRHEV